MSVESKLQRFEGLVASLHGESITRVRYATIDYGDGIAAWDYGALHNPELGVEFAMSSGAVIQIGWGWDFNQYGLAASGGVDPSLWNPTVVIWDVSDHPGWARLMSGVPTSALVYWHGSTDADPVWPEYPQDLELTFASHGRVWICAAQYDVQTGRVYGSGDEIVVTFDTDTLRRHGLGPFARQERLRRISGA